MAIMLVLTFISTLFLPMDVFAIPPDQQAVVLTTWSLPTYSKDIMDMISDFAGNVYFVETDANKIGRLESATNLITEWNLATINTSGSSGPTGIAFDPATGSIFYAETGANKIGRLVPAINTITEWTLPNKSGSVGFKDIVFDGIGSVYFIEKNGNTIGKLVTSENTFTEWTLPNKSANILSLVTHFDGGIYFSETGANKIGRLVPATNTITEWNLATINTSGSSGPTGIAFDPATGSIYFSETGANKIGRLVPATNTITEWNVSNNPLAITSTPGGSIYFIDEIGRIGRIG